MNGTMLVLVLAMMWFGGFFLGWGTHEARYPCPDTTDQTRTRETQWAKQMQELRGRAFRAEQATAEAMIEAARLQDRLQPWDNGYFMLVEQGTPEWGAAMCSMGLCTNAAKAALVGGVN